MPDGHPSAHAPALHAGVPVDQNGPVEPPSTGGRPESGFPFPASSVLASAAVHAVPHVPQWSTLVFKSVHTPASVPAQWMSGDVHVAESPLVVPPSLVDDPSGPPPPASSVGKLVATAHAATKALEKRTSKRRALRISPIYDEPWMNLRLIACAMAFSWSSVARADACRLWNMCGDEKPPAERTGEGDLWTHGKQAHPANVSSFIGLTVAAGVLNGGYTASQSSMWGKGVDSTLLFALRAGVLLGRTELALEVAPFSDVWDAQRAKGPAFQANATFGYLIPFKQLESGSLAWPLRAGIGVLAGNTNDNVFFEARVDPIGVVYRTGSILLDFHVVSFRYAITNGHVDGIPIEGVTTHYLSFFSGSSISYLF
jgi:hypothetical protein